MLALLRGRERPPSPPPRRPSETPAPSQAAWTSGPDKSPSSSQSGNNRRGPPRSEAFKRMDAVYAALKAEGQAARPGLQAAGSEPRYPEDEGGPTVPPTFTRAPDGYENRRPEVPPRPSESAFGSSVRWAFGLPRRVTNPATRPYPGHQ